MKCLALLGLAQTHSGMDTFQYLKWYHLLTFTPLYPGLCSGKPVLSRHIGVVVVLGFCNGKCPLEEHFPSISIMSFYNWPSTTAGKMAPTMTCLRQGCQVESGKRNTGSDSYFVLPVTVCSHTWGICLVRLVHVYIIYSQLWPCIVHEHRPFSLS